MPTVLCLEDLLDILLGVIVGIGHVPEEQQE